MASPFEANRRFVSKLQDDADGYYRDFFGPHERFPVEEIEDGSVEAELDYSGTDQIIKTDGEPMTYHVAQRFRKRRSGGPTDFSIRVESSGFDTEYKKLMLNQSETAAHLPGLYAFGITDDVDDGFGDFYFLSVELLVEALKQDALRTERHRNFVDGSPDGTKAMYIPVGDLNKKGVIIAHYEDGDRRF